MQGESSESVVGTVLGLLAILFWGVSVAISRRLMEQVGYFTAGSSVYLLAGVISCAASFRSLKHMVHMPRGYLLACGGLLVLYTTCVYFAVGTATRQQVVEIVMLNYLWPGLTVLLSVPILRFKAKATLPLGVAGALAGGILALAQGEQVFSWSGIATHVASNPGSYAAALAAAVSWALFSNLSRRLAGDVRGSAMPLFILVTGFALLALRGVRPENTRWSPSAAAMLLYMAIFPITLAYVFWDHAMHRGKLVVVTVASYFTPILCVLTVSFVLHVRATGKLWMACALVVVGAAISRLSLRENTAPDAAPGG